MKSTIISMIIVLVVMVVLPMIFLGDGNFAQQLGFGGGGNGASPTKLPANVKTVVTDKKVEVYTWVDANGIKPFSNTPPPEGGASEKIVLKPNTNIMDPINIPEEEEVVASQPKVFSVGNPYTPGGMKDMIDSSKDIQESMGQQQVERNKMMQDLFPQMGSDKK
jgi:hypothetical protein